MLKKVVMLVMALILVLYMLGCKDTHQCTMPAGDNGAPVVVPCHHGGNPS